MDWITYKQNLRLNQTKGPPGNQQQKTLTFNVPFNKRKTYDDHGLAHTAAPHGENLPKHIRTSGEITTFRKLLKTHYFKLANNT